MKRLLFTVMVFVLGFAGGAYWATHPGEATEGAGIPGHSGVGYSSLTLDHDEYGSFEGTLQVRNAPDVATTVYVTVHVYDGDQNIGNLLGQVSLKPNSKSGVALTSADRYQAYTDTTVELLPVG